MGYRSNVKIAIYPVRNYDKPEDELPMAALKLWFDENYPVHEAHEKWEARIDYGKDYILISYEEVKWHEGYNHPGHVQEVCRRSEEVFGGKVAYECIRTGEEPSDLDFDLSYNHESRMWVSREIVFS